MAADGRCSNGPFSHNAGLVVGTAVLSSGAAMLSSLSSGDANNAAFLATKTGAGAGRTTGARAHAEAPTMVAGRAWRIVSPSCSGIAVGMLCTVSAVAAKTAAARRQRGKQSSQRRGAERMHLAGRVQGIGLRHGRVASGNPRAAMQMRALSLRDVLLQTNTAELLALKEPEVFSEKVSWTGLTPGKEYELQTQCCEVAENTRTIRSLDWQRDRFDIEFALSNGTTYNAYTIKGETHTALIDASHKKFEKIFMDALESPTGGDIDLSTLSYIVVSHTEPDHSGLLENILTLADERGNKDVTVVGSKICINFLKDLMHMKFNSMVVKGGDEIDLGGGHVLEFVLAPNLHWPDTIFTYDRKTQLMYTCDAFGMHYCSGNVTDVEEVKELLPHYQLYYDCLMKPNARSVVSAMKKLPDLSGDVKAIATGHGPMMVEHLDEWLAKYKSWSENATKKIGPSTAIFWTSRHAESERFSQQLAYGLTSADVTVEMYDLNATDAFEVVEACHRCSTVAVFAPPAGDCPAQQALSSVIASCAPKENKFLVCSSIGEAGQTEEPVEAIVARFRQLGIPEAMPALRTQRLQADSLCPLSFYSDAGLKLAKQLTSKKKQAAKDGLDPKTMAALGKMGSGRYVVTAKRQDVRQALLATWVMPASTEPPSVSIALPKDHPLVTLCHIGDNIVINMLEEGNYIDIQKHFQQDFELGADVFAGVDLLEVDAEQGDAEGLALKGAAAYLVCRVISRMEAHDHTIICAEALNGQLIRDAPTAVNYRKSAAYY